MPAIVAGIMSAKFPVRCRLKKCRARRNATVHPDDMKRIPKCHKCGGRHGWRIERRPENRQMCTCGKVINVKYATTVPHRVGGHPLCDHHPEGILNQAKRAGLTGDYLMDAAIESVGREMKPDDPCPF